MKYKQHRFSAFLEIVALFSLFFHFRFFFFLTFIYFFLLISKLFSIFFIPWRRLKTLTSILRGGSPGNPQWVFKNLSMARHDRRKLIKRKMIIFRCPVGSELLN